MSFTEFVFYGVAVLRIKKTLAVVFDLIIKFISYILHRNGLLACFRGILQHQRYSEISYSKNNPLYQLHGPAKPICTAQQMAASVTAVHPNNLCCTAC
jgi:hypothetical protein